MQLYIAWRQALPEKNSSQDTKSFPMWLENCLFAVNPVPCSYDLAGDFESESFGVKKTKNELCSLTQMKQAISSTSMHVLPVDVGRDKLWPIYLGKRMVNNGVAIINNAKILFGSQF